MLILLKINLLLALILRSMIGKKDGKAYRANKETVAFCFARACFKVPPQAQAGRFQFLASEIRKSA